MDASSSFALNRLLTRLDHSLLSGEQDSRLRGSRYERQKATSNVEHARTLLLTLEKQSITIKAPAQKQQTQTDLQQKRELIKRLNARLQELNQAGDEEGNNDDDDSDEDDDEQNNAASYAPAIKDTQDGLDSITTSSSSPNPAALLSQLQPALQQQQSRSQQQRSQQQQSPPDLRSRRPLTASDNRSAATTTARESLFANRSHQPATSPTSELPQRETLLTHNRHEQENLTTGLLGLAQALKQSSQQFSQSLADEKDVLKRAEGGLEKSALGMEAAERRMGMLRRMSEGEGWWGRLKLYGFIAALWVGCFLVVFVGPKLRL